MIWSLSTTILHMTNTLVFYDYSLGNITFLATSQPYCLYTTACYYLLCESKSPTKHCAQSRKHLTDSFNTLILNNFFCMQLANCTVIVAHSADQPALSDNHTDNVYVTASHLMPDCNQQYCLLYLIGIRDLLTNHE